MNDITQFSMTDLTKRIAEQTQAQFGSLIPKEMFEGLIEESVKAFFEENKRYEVKEVIHPDDTRKYSYEQRKLSVLTHELTPFRQMVWLRLKELVAPLIDEWLKEQHDALREHVRAELSGPDLSKPFNQSVGALGAVITTQQIYTTMSTALGIVGDQIRIAMKTQHIPDGFGVSVTECVPGGRG